MQFLVLSKLTAGQNVGQTEIDFFPKKDTRNKTLRSI